MRSFNILHNVTVELVSHCNSACIHCYLEHPSPKIVDYEQVMNVIDQARDAGAMQITLTGGEPLLHPAVCDIIKYIKSKNMAVNIVTSLNLTPGNWLNDLLLCDKIGVSLYGSTESLHDSIARKPGSFKRMTNNLFYLIDKGACVTLNVTAMKENVADIANMKAFADQNKVQCRINYILHGTAAQSHQIELDQIGLLKTVCSFGENTGNHEKNFMCVAGRRSLWVDVDQNVYPCVFFRLLLGNLLIQTVADIWNNSESIMALKKTANADFEKCLACKLKQTCTPCIGENFNASGSVSEPSVFSCKIGELGNQLMLC